ncbi:hypothetical protein COU89_01065 [Candidatus Roizmanbacteria bacterium CG10_big_fil_rev_8_21_14_0_10_45_7]|uniref:GIY-YIG domain-containing protein n=1 Tax=Candidatus Roizmanbacteria bacterium CG10_big_fil_rev_8_21_14_0_10_45_7 TaxID=1974854 RepID=A0A2M8KV95_9BACT|nr:MAG: hypothetical protein COU89_01065 [Candidatus Roizmanbacteria bacterium CG10_big_fil_rev_8_21_14_0_10_45_7]
MYYIYILRTSANTLYIGQTNNLERRLKEHFDKKSKAAKYTRSFETLTLVYQEEYETRNEVMRRERQVKKWPKAKKEALITGSIKSKMKDVITDVSILGAGDMAKGIGTRLVAGGNNVTFFDRNTEKAQGLQKELTQVATGEVVVASKRLGESLSGEIVILAIPYEAVPGVIEQYGDELVGKILVDITNPVNFENFTLTTPPGSSAAEEIAKMVPGNTKVVKSFNTTFSGTLVEGVINGKPLDVFIAGDNNEAKGVVANLIESGGLRAIDAGPLESARALEGMQLIHIRLQEQLGTNWMSGIQITSEV